MNYGIRAINIDVKKSIKKPAGPVSTSKRVSNRSYSTGYKFSVHPNFPEENLIHRSVSERNKYPNQKREKSPKKEPSNICNQQCNKLGYFQSTPNVAIKGTRTLPATMIKKEKSMYNATSESELLDREILPIFQKLLTERNKSQHNIDYSFGRSCPNISIKCDIVEYL